MKYYHFGAILVLSYLGLTIPLTAIAQTAPSANIPTATINRPDLNMGSRGEFVQELQAALKLLGYYNATVDGIYGEATAQAVVRFQRDALVNATGLVNQQTWLRLFPMGPALATTPTVVVPTSPPPTSTNTTSNPENTTNTTNPTNPENTTNTTNPSQTAPRAEDLPLLKEGMGGDEVKLLQERLKALGFYNGPIDGIFGRNTLQAVLAAQIYFKIDGDGIVGLQTWRRILGQ